MPADELARLARLIGRGGTPSAVGLGGGCEPREAIGRLRSATPTAALWGRWFGGGAVLLRDPLCWLSFDHAEDAFDLLDRQPSLSTVPEGSLGGGWLACLGYARNTTCLGFFDHLLRWVPGGGWTFETLGLHGRERDLGRALEESRSLVSGTGEAADPDFAVGAFEAAPRAEEIHLRGIESAIARIERGDFYQLNLCTRMRAPFAGRPARVFAEAVDRLRPDYGAMIVTGSGSAVISFSPELFLAVHDDQVRTAPIKGTSAAAADRDGAALVGSRKDVAENIMITDLMRNDLSRVCLPGTVRVERLLELQAHPGVWHLVSTVAGNLPPDSPRAELLRATYPPGSVTGAPKISAQSGIADLEAQSRGAYTGALGFLTPSAGAELSVIIRTFEISAGEAQLGVGGGITVDSVPVREWQECLHKAEPLVRAIGSELTGPLRDPPAAIPDPLRRGGLIETLLSRDGVVLRLAAHLARLERSCRELYELSVEADLAYRLQQEADGRAGDRTGLRVRVVPSVGRLEIMVDSWTAPPPPRRLRLVRRQRPAWSWRHKWGDRTALTRPEPIANPSADVGVVPYFTTPNGHLAETSWGNLCCLGTDGVWRTPPEDEHVLPGITRRDVLQVWTDLGRPFSIDRLPASAAREATAVLSTSSISGVVVVEQIDDHVLGVPDDLVAHVGELNRRLGFG